MEKNLKYSLPPIINGNPKILILGSMPGEESLRTKQYYAHPRNFFWMFIAEIFKFPKNLNYQERVRYLIRENLALWDVLAYCEREGSLDSKIKEKSEKANEINELVQTYSSIKRILFNGKKSYQSFEKHIFRTSTAVYKNIELKTLPSTSPANASIPKQIKYEMWSKSISSEIT